MAPRRATERTSHLVWADSIQTAYSKDRRGWGHRSPPEGSRSPPEGSSTEARAVWCTQDQSVDIIVSSVPMHCQIRTRPCACNHVVTSMSRICMVSETMKAALGLADSNPATIFQNVLMAFRKSPERCHSVKLRAPYDMAALLQTMLAAGATR